MNPKVLNAKLSHAEKLAYDSGHGDLAMSRAQNTYNQNNPDAIKDYLFPEIRALEDRTDIWALKEAMKLKKVSD